MKKLFTILTALTALLSLASAQAGEKPALDGYCPVCYIAAGKAAKGSAEFASTHDTVFSVVDGKVYLNKDAEIGKEFAKDKEGNIKKADVKWAELSK